MNVKGSAMICPNCGHQNRAHAKFCEECGIVLPSNPAARASAVAPQALSTTPRRNEPARANPSVEDREPYPSGTTMLAGLRTDDGRARRIFALVALALLLWLCACCGLLLFAFYALTQNPGTSLLSIVVSV